MLRKRQFRTDQRTDARGDTITPPSFCCPEIKNEYWRHSLPEDLSGMNHHILLRELIAYLSLGERTKPGELSQCCIKVADGGATIN